MPPFGIERAAVKEPRHGRDETILPLLFFVDPQVALFADTKLEAGQVDREAASLESSDFFASGLVTRAAKYQLQGTLALASHHEGTGADRIPRCSAVHDGTSAMLWVAAPLFLCLGQDKTLPT